MTAAILPNFLRRVLHGAPATRRGQVVLHQRLVGVQCQLCVEFYLQVLVACGLYIFWIAFAKQIINLHESEELVIFLLQFLFPEGFLLQIIQETGERDHVLLLPRLTNCSALRQLIHNVVDVLYDIVHYQLVERIAYLIIKFVDFRQVLLLDISYLKWLKVRIVAVASVHGVVFGAHLAIRRASVIRARITHY